MGLDSFFAAAARAARRPGGKSEELINQATELLTQHPHRSTEIALSVQRLRTSPELVAPFAARFAQLAKDQLPTGGEALTRNQARDALFVYVTLCDLGAARHVSDPIASSVAASSSALEAPSLAVALAKVGATGSSSAEVALALQEPLARDGALTALSPGDLHALVVGLARVPEIMPSLVTLVVDTLMERILEMPPVALCDAARATAELRARLWAKARGENDAVHKMDARLQDLLPHLATALQGSPSAGPAAVAQCALALNRMVSALPPGSVARSALVSEVLRPSAAQLLVLSKDPAAFELVAPLLRECGGEAWEVLLQMLALEALPTLPSDNVGAERLAEILEHFGEEAAAKPAFPPFFDFALEELLHRLPGVQPQRLQRLARFYGQAHLERPDLLPQAMAAFAAAAQTPAHQMVKASDLALRLSGFAALYVRVSELKLEKPDELTTALVAITEVLSMDGMACEDALSKTHTITSTTARDADATSTRDSACLALSAFTQVLVQARKDLAPGARDTVVQRGRRLLEVTANALLRDRVTLSPPQMHVFITAFRALCVGQSVASPPQQVVEALHSLLRQAAKAAVTDRDAHHILSMFGELASEPDCPEAVRALLADGDATAASEVARDKLRRNVQASAREAADRVSQMPQPGASQAGVSGFVRRIFGF